MQSTPATRAPAEAQPSRLAIGRVARGNSLTAQNDEPEPSPMCLELQAMANQIKARNAAKLPPPALQLIAAGPSSAPTLEDYRATLARHDWSFEFSDDPSAYRAGRTSLLAIRSMQPRLDPDFAVWNQHAPADFRRSPA